MTHFEIDAATLHEFLGEFPLYQIAQLCGCQGQDILAVARRYGLGDICAARPATEAEIAEILRLANEGWSTKRIAIYLGRSQYFVGERINMLEALPDRPTGRPFRIRWPKVTTTPEEALVGRTYEDADEELLLRECPPGRWPINGTALAAAGRWAAASQSRSAADLCVEA